MRDELRRAALVTSGVFDLTRQKADQVVKDLVSSGFVRSDQASQAVKELLGRSTENRKDLVGFVRSELKNQIEKLGLATKRDVERLERRVARLEAAAKSGGKSKKKTTAKKTSSASKGTGSSAPKSSAEASETPTEAISENRANGGEEG